MLQKNQLNLIFKPTGETFDINSSNSKFIMNYKHLNGCLYLGNSINWLESIEDSSIDMIFADPPYNIKKADWDNFKSQEEYIKWSISWIKQASRVLKPTGTLFICGFSEILSDIKHPASKYFDSCRWLIWHYKNKANLGKDWSRSHESILHFRKSKNFILNLDKIRIPYGNHTLKYPSHPQAKTSNFGNGKKNHEWTPNPLGAKPKDVIEIPTTCNGMNEKTPHPTQKPEELIRKLVLASSNKDDIILDPFSGSGTTLVVAEQLNRKWLGCDLNKEYNVWAIERIEKVKKIPEQEWIEFDRQNVERRNKIR